MVAATAQARNSKEQKANRADVTTALTDQTNMDIMDRWGKSSSEDRRRRKEQEEKDKKCTASPSVVELVIANLLVVLEISNSTTASLRLHIGGGAAIGTFFLLRWESARLLTALYEIINGGGINIKTCFAK